MANKAQVKAILIDMMGKKVANIYEGELEQGAHKLNIITENLASGLYQVQVMMGNKISTQKLSIVK